MTLANQYYANDYTTQSTDSINFYKITKAIFHRTRTKIFTICMETQKTPNSQSSVEKEKQLGKSDSLISDYTTQLG